MHVRGEHRWRVIRTPGVYVGAARNAGWRAALGTFVLFMDDDNVALPHEVSTMVRVALHTDASVVTCANLFMPAQFAAAGAPAVSAAATAAGTYVPLGPAAAAATVQNVLGDANAMFRREALRLLGGWPEDLDYGTQDWELLTRAALKVGLAGRTTTARLVCSKNRC